MKKSKRKQLIVNPQVQLKLIGLIIVVAIAPVIVLFIGFTLYAGSLLAKIPAGNGPLVQLIESVQMLNILTFLGFIIVLIVLAIVETKFLHKIMGPLYRIECDLQEMISSKSTKKRITVRKDDYLHPLVEKLNRVLEMHGEK